MKVKEFLLPNLKRPKDHLFGVSLAFIKIHLLIDFGVVVVFRGMFVELRKEVFSIKDDANPTSHESLFPITLVNLSCSPVDVPTFNIRGIPRGVVMNWSQQYESVTLGK